MEEESEMVSSGLVKEGRIFRWLLPTSQSKSGVPMEFQYKLTFGKISGAYLRLEDWKLYGETGGFADEEEEGNKQPKS
ncbi:unnamed protein product, partial [Linum tenue]